MRWVPVGAEETRAHAEFGDDGTWRGSDGCNSQGGGYRLGEQGRLVTISGVQTLIGCAGPDVGGVVDGAGRAGLDGEVLVLLDASGRERGRLRRG